MSECFITLELSSDDSKASLRLIDGFQELRQLNDADEKILRETMNKYFGEPFSAIIFSELASEEDVLKYKRFIPKKYLEGMDHFMFSLKNKTLNDRRIWQDTYSEAISGYEVCPSDIALKTRSEITKSSYDKIVLDYDSDENYILKAAVFAAAFESIDFYVESISTNNEYEP
jgi:hypothetical protein